MRFNVPLALSAFRDKGSWLWSCKKKSWERFLISVQIIYNSVGGLEEGVLWIRLFSFTKMWKNTANEYSVAVLTSPIYSSI